MNLSVSVKADEFTAWLITVLRKRQTEYLCEIIRVNKSWLIKKKEEIAKQLYTREYCNNWDI